MLAKMNERKYWKWGRERDNSNAFEFIRFTLLTSKTPIIHTRNRKEKKKWIILLEMQVKPNETTREGTNNGKRVEKKIDWLWSSN